MPNEITSGNKGGQKGNEYWDTDNPVIAADHDESTVGDGEEEDDSCITNINAAEDSEGR